MHHDREVVVDGNKTKEAYMRLRRARAIFETDYHRNPHRFKNIFQNINSAYHILSEMQPSDEHDHSYPHDNPAHKHTIPVRVSLSKLSECSQKIQDARDSINHQHGLDQLNIDDEGITHAVLDVRKAYEEIERLMTASSYSHHISHHRK